MVACCDPGTVETSGNTSAMKVNAVAGHMKRLVKRPDISETMLKLKKNYTWEIQNDTELFRWKKRPMLEAVGRDKQGGQMKNSWSWSNAAFRGKSTRKNLLRFFRTLSGW